MSCEYLISSLSSIIICVPFTPSWNLPPPASVFLDVSWEHVLPQIELRIEVLRFLQAEGFGLTSTSLARSMVFSLCLGLFPNSEGAYLLINVRMAGTQEQTIAKSISTALHIIASAVAYVLSAPLINSLMVNRRNIEAMQISIPTPNVAATMIFSRRRSLRDQTTGIGSNQISMSVAVCTADLPVYKTARGKH